MADFEDKIPFQIMRGLEEKILNKPKDDGRLYFATDTGKIYLDTLEENKILMGGGANSGIFYAKKNLLIRPIQLLLQMISLVTICLMLMI